MGQQGLAYPVGAVDLRLYCVYRNSCRDGGEKPGQAPGLELLWGIRDIKGSSVSSVGVIRSTHFRQGLLTFQEN